MIPEVRRDAYYQERAREQRNNMNDAERRLWSRLRAHRMDGRKFRRQHPLGRYIVDFVCLDSRLIIESTVIRTAMTAVRLSISSEQPS